MPCNVSVDLNEFERIDYYCGHASFYGHNYYKHKELEYYIYVESNDECWNDVYLMSHNNRVYLVSGYINFDTNIVEGELKRQSS